MKKLIVTLLLASALGVVGYTFGVNIKELWSNTWLQGLGPKGLKQVKVAGLFPSGYDNLRLWSAVAGFILGGAFAFYGVASARATRSNAKTRWIAATLAIITVGSVVCQAAATRAWVNARLLEKFGTSGSNVVAVPQGINVGRSGKLPDRAPISVMQYTEKNTLNFGRVALAIGGIGVALLIGGCGAIHNIGPRSDRLGHGAAACR